MQQTFGFEELFTRGGWRPGSGRKVNKDTVSHGIRDLGRKDDPVLVTWKRRQGLKGFRVVKEASVISKAIRAARRPDFRVVHFSLPANHLHLHLEADSADAMARGTKGLGCRIAKGLNKLWHRRGKVFVGRFHSHVLRSLAEIRNALRYVLNNYLKHGCQVSGRAPDIFSTGHYFDGWSDHEQEKSPHAPDSYVSPPGFKIAVLWKRHHPPFPLASVPGH